MLKHFNFKLFRKLLILAALLCALSAAFMPGSNKTRAALICCDLCEPNYNACLGTCGVDDKCPQLCAAAYANCALTCGVGDC
jgi:hypothetical protein